MLIYLDFQKPFVLATATLGTALDAVLSQIYDRTKRLIVGLYVSHQMNAAEINN